MSLFIIGSYLLGFFLLYHVRTCKASNKGIKNQYSIIIPARNEAHNLPKLLDSLQDQPNEVIVVNDHSEDDTEAVSLRYPNVKLVSIQEEHPDWNGKSYALYQGSKMARNDHFIFLDADVCIEQAGLTKLIETYEVDETPCSIQPYHKIEKNYESFSLVFNIIALMSSGMFMMCKRRKTQSFFGPCIILKKTDYEAMGTHQAIKHAIVDDLAFGQALIENGYTPRVYSGKDTISFRMYPSSLKELMEGWSKNIAIASTKISIVISGLITIFFIGVYASMVYFSLPLYGLYVLQTYILGKKVMNITIIHACFYPLYYIFFMFLFLYSFYKRIIRKEVVWKGRKIKV